MGILVNYLSKPIIKKTKMPGFFKLIVLSFFIELLIPVIYWWTGQFGYYRWFTHGITLAIVLLGSFRIITTKRAPKSLFFVAGCIVYWGLIPLFHGQTFLATFWGVWIFFRFPLLGIMVYVLNRNYRHIHTKIGNWLISILLFEVLVQFIQYLAGNDPGDLLAGTLSLLHGGGTTILFFYTMFVICFITSGLLTTKYNLVLTSIVLALSMISSVLGEIKVFFFTLPLVLLSGMILITLKKRNLLRSVPLLIITLLILFVFVFAYQQVIPDGVALDFLDRYSLSKYLTIAYAGDKVEGYNVGRNYILSYVFDDISSDKFTLFFGYGFGARSLGNTLGTSGVSLINSDLGNTIISSFAVFLGEIGIVGVSFLVFSFGYITVLLIKKYVRTTDKDDQVLYMTLIIYTLLMPLWIWYSTFWTFGLPNLIYWSFLGYSFTLKKTRGTYYE